VAQVVRKRLTKEGAFCLLSSFYGSLKLQNQMHCALMEKMTVTNVASSSAGNAWARPQSDKVLRSSKTKQSDRMPAPPPGLSLSINHKFSTNNASPEDVLRERFLHLHLSLVEKPVTITRTDGSVLEGIFHASTPFRSASLKKEYWNQYILKECTIVSKATTDSLEPIEEGTTAIIPMSSISQIVATSLKLELNTNTRTSLSSKPLPTFSNGNHINNNGSTFRTDTDISGGIDNDKNDDLVLAGSTWISCEDNASDLNGKKSSEDSSLGRGGLFGTASSGLSTKGGKTLSSDDGELKGGIGQWDQFSVNETKFGVKASFDENLYTTSLNKTSLDEKKILQANRIAKEIEGTSTTNIHLAEERGQSTQVDYDEEDLYSGVLVKDGSVTNTKERVKLVLKPRSVVASTDNQIQKDSINNVMKDSVDSHSPISESNLQNSSTSKAAMNYAAAAAKDVKKIKQSSPTESIRKNINTSELISANKPTESNDIKEEDNADTRGKDEEITETNESTEQVGEVAKLPNDSSQQEECTEAEASNGDAKEIKSKSSTKLNANAKSFSFNPSAKSFTPSFPGAVTPVITAPTSMEPAAVTVPHQYVQYSHMQPGIPVGAPIMHYQPYPGGGGVRYPQGNTPPYMIQSGPVPISNTQGQSQPPSIAPKSDNMISHNNRESEKNTETSEVSGESVETQDTDSGAHKKQDSALNEGQEISQHQQGVQMVYGVPHSGYYPSAPMHPGGRGPSPQHFQPQMAQQIPIVPGRNPYNYNIPPGHLQGGMHNVPHYNQVRDAGGYTGTPYISSGYGGAGQGGHGSIDDEMGYRGGGRGRGRNGGRRNRKGGRGNGGRGYHNSYHSSTYGPNNSQQHQFSNDTSNEGRSSESKREGQLENATDGSE